MSRMIVPARNMSSAISDWYSSGPRVYSSTLPARLGLFKARLIEGRGRKAKFVRLIVAGETDSARTTVMLTDLARQIVRS